MQPLKITIFGDFWDCQIYRGRLYLWKMDGKLLVYDWDNFIDSLIEKPSQKLAITCAFSRGDFLYGRSYYELFNNFSEIKNLIRDKFNLISKKTYAFEEKDLVEYLYGEQQNPFKELQTDTEIYVNKLYAILENGLWVSNSHRQNEKFPVSTKPKKLTDCPLLSLKARGKKIALSGGSEGLFEYYIDSTYLDYQEYDNEIIKKVDHELFQISPKHSLFSDWSFSCIYSSSDIDDSFMAAFVWKDIDEDFKIKARAFEKIIDQKAIFKMDGLKKMSWGSNDKIYRASNGGLDVVRFTQNYIGSEEEELAFSNVEHIPFMPWKGEIIGGGVSFFGTIVECENALVIIQSDNNICNIKEPVTRWRIYPRSIRYENHLHVILKDRIEIYSFNHDYFIDQKEKEIGIDYWKVAFNRKEKVKQ